MSAADPVRPRVLAVEHDHSLQRALQQVVHASNATASLAGSLAEATQLIQREAFDAVLVEHALPDGEGLELLRAKPDLQAQVLLLVDLEHVSAGTGEALRFGVFDCVLKPFDLDGLARRLSVALECQRLASDRERLQTLLTRAEQLALVGKLSASIAHEINNPLSCVLAGAELLAREFSAQQRGRASMPLEELQELTESLRLGAERIRQIVVDLRAWSHRGGPSAVNLGRVQLRSVVDTALDFARHELNHRACVVRDDADAPPVQAHAGRLGQVVVNLLVNAAQAMPPRDRAQNEIRIRAGANADGWVALEIADNGVGMPPEVKARLFEPFFTTKPVGEGTGLGLSISRDIVEGLGGKLEVESAVGRGTTFRVLLRAAPPAN